MSFAERLGGYVARAAVGTVGAAGIMAYTLQENSWLRWEVDRVSQSYAADQLRIADLETMSGEVKSQNKELKAAVNALQAERVNLVKQLASTSKTRRLLQARRATQCTSLQQQLSSVQQELAVAVSRERSTAARLQQLQSEHNGKFAAKQAVSDALKADVAALKANEGRLSSEVERLSAVIATMKAGNTKGQLPHTAGNSTHVPSSSTAVITYATLQQALQLLQQNLQQGTIQMGHVNSETNLAEASGHADSLQHLRTAVETHKGSSCESAAQDHRHKAAEYSSDVQDPHNPDVAPIILQLTIEQDQSGSEQQLEKTKLQLVQLQGQLAASRTAHAGTQQLKELSSKQVQPQTQQFYAQAHQQQLSTTHAAELKALVKQHSELQTAHTNTEAELWELADAHADLNVVHDASMDQLAEANRQLAMLQKSYRRLSCDRAFVQAQLCSTAAALVSSRRQHSAVAADMQKLENKHMCVKSQREGINATLERLGDVRSQWAGLLAAAEGKQRVAVERASCVETEMAEVQHRNECLQQRLDNLLAGQKSQSSATQEMACAGDFIKAVPGKASHHNLSRTDSARDNPSPRRR